MAKASCALQTLPALGSGSMGTAILAQQFLFARAQSLHVQGRMWQCCVWVIPALLWTFPKTATNKNCDHHPNLSTVWCSHMCSCVHVALIYVVRGLQHGAPVYVMHGPNVVLLCTRFMVHGPQHGAPVSLHMKRARPLCGCSWRSCQGNRSDFHRRWWSTPISLQSFPSRTQLPLPGHQDSVLSPSTSPSMLRESNPCCPGTTGPWLGAAAGLSFLSDLSNRKENCAV